VLDIDEAELRKPTVRPNLAIHADLKPFLASLRNARYSGPSEAHRNYLEWCLQRRRQYPTVLPEYEKEDGPVNPYCFAQALFRQLPERERVVTGDGTACVVTFQAAELKRGQRLYTNSGCAAMGYDLPAAIGACFGSGKQRIICITGDGSIQLNLQELQTIVTHRLPIKIFLLNNQGYHSIRQTQGNYFPDNIVGCGPESGLEFPDFGKISDAYGIPFRRIQRHSEMLFGIQATLEGEGPQMCEVVLDLRQQFAPKLSSRKLPDGRMVTCPLEDLAPFLSREELAENMLIPPVTDSNIDRS
jgi:acetolactate synthase-1/2/3 large subunit